MTTPLRPLAALPALALALVALLAPAAAAQSPVASAEVERWSNRVWSGASGSDDEILQLISQLPADAAEELGLMWLVDSVERYDANIAQREAARHTRVEEIEAEIASYPEEIDLRTALLRCVELFELGRQDEATLDRPMVQRIVREAEIRAADLEAQERWLDAHNLYNRLHLLYEESGRFKRDLVRLNQRLLMLRLYVPERLHEMRSAQRVAEGEDALPPFNPIGDDWTIKLADIDERMVLESLLYATRYHVDEIDLPDLLIGGLEAVRTMARTPDLAAAMPTLGDADRRATFVAGVDEQIAALPRMRRGMDDHPMMFSVVRGLLRLNRSTIDVPVEAILHEFGNGAVGRLDDFTAIIWPDELANFQRNTQGRFYGVGIQITLNDALELEVVTPLSGTPAARAGIRSGDLIRKIDDEPTLGIALSQAVDRITGKRGTTVTLGIEREGVDGILPITLRRDIIPIYAVKGWKRAGTRETDWDWMIDPEAGIGYVRVTQFNNNTTRDLREAIRQMQGEGLEGLVLDLRYNPGGLLSEAVGVANLFIDRGIVVTQEDKDGDIVDAQEARPSKVLLRDLPLVVLVDGGSASASEIVAGCLQDYDRAVLVGKRTYGKGSVQNVYRIQGDTAAFKLTTHFYKLPGGRKIHKSPERPPSQWGVAPDVVVDMLPDQISDALRLRQDADVVELDENGDPIADPDRPDPVQLLDEGIDPQLETALLLLQARIASEQVAARWE